MTSWRGSCRFSIHARICRRSSTSGKVAPTPIIGAGESSDLPGVGVPSGAYALICRINLLGDFIFREQYVASPIEVTGDLPGVSTP